MAVQCVFVTSEMCLCAIEYVQCSLSNFVTFRCLTSVMSLSFPCDSCLHHVQFKIVRERVMCESLVGLNLGSSLG